MRNSHYWQVLFDPRSWQAFVTSGGRTLGFREGRLSSVQQIHTGDTLLCYLTGVSRWVGAVVARGEAFHEDRDPNSDDPLPLRLPVTPLVSLSPETAVPVQELQEHLSIFQEGDGEHWTARFRASPSRWPRADGELIMEALLDGQLQPVVREVEPRRLARRSSLLGSFRPAGDTSPPPLNFSGLRKNSSHNEIQWLLLKLGSEMGLQLWVARNDRGRRWAGQRFDQFPGILDALPQPFEPNTRKIIEMIDVLWLRGNAIIAAFEVESTTVIYSGLLRMADLVTLQPNLSIPLYLVAPDRRREKVMAEIQRPSFARLSPPLPKICRFVAFSALRLRAQEVAPVLSYLSPDFIHEIAEPCDAPREAPG